MRPRVLLADDYPDLLNAYKRMLSPSCDVVACVTSGAAVFEAFETSQPDVVIVDLFIPPGNGLEICRDIKHVSPETAVIIVSASDEADVGKQAIEAGASAFISKLSAVDTLLPAIQRAMAARSLADS
jgi:DNA-binding NarL/FixJ family response regulator